MHSWTVVRYVNRAIKSIMNKIKRDRSFVEKLFNLGNVENKKKKKIKINYIYARIVVRLYIYYAWSTIPSINILNINIARETVINKIKVYSKESIKFIYVIE